MSRLKVTFIQGSVIGWLQTGIDQTFQLADGLFYLLSLSHLQVKDIL